MSAESVPEPGEANWAINPEYLTASHVVLLVYHGAPSFSDQLAHDAEVQMKLENELQQQCGGNQD